MPGCLSDPRLTRATVQSPLGSFPMAVLSSEDLVSREIKTRGFWEIRTPSELLRLANMPNATIPLPGTFVDIGANLGFYSLLFAQHGYEVLAMEPMLLNRKAIEASLCMNPTLAARVTLLPYALGASATARCVVRADDRNAGNGKLTCSPSERCERPLGKQKTDASSHITICEPVTMSTLDRVLAQRSTSLQAAPVAAVKLDVEGQVSILLG